MRVLVPGPGDVLRLAGKAWQAAEQLVDLVPRLVTLVGEVEEIVRILRTIDDVEVRLADAVAKSLSIVDRVEPILTEFAPTLRLLHPMLRRIADSTDPAEVEAVVRLVNDLPDLVTKIHVDVLPVLTSLGSVPEDLREILVTSKELNEIIAAVPGLGRMRQRALRDVAAQDASVRERERRAASAPTDRS